MERERGHLIERDPSQVRALRVTDDWVEAFPRASENRRVRPVAQIDDRLSEHLNELGRNAGFFVGLADGGVDSSLAVLPGASRQAPGSPEMAPFGSELQQHS